MHIGVLAFRGGCGDVPLGLMTSPSDGAAASGSTPHPRSSGKKITRSADQINHRDWSGLPKPALFSIAISLTGSLADVFAFGCVCREWRSTAKDSERDLMASLPPLLFRDSHADLYCPATGRSYRNERLTALLEGEGRFETVGCSFGHLIVHHFDSGAGNRGPFSIVNPLKVTVCIRFPPVPHITVRWAALSSPPASPNCVLWASNGCWMEFCRQEDDKWTTFSSPQRRCSLISPPVSPRRLRKYLNYERYLAALGIKPCTSEQTALLPWDPSRPYPCWDVRLYVSDAEVLIISGIRTVPRQHSSRIKEFQVHRVDAPPAGELRTVRLNSLGGRAMFWDSFGVTVSKINPSRWGGRGNCIYFADRHDDLVGVFHLEDGKMECLARGSSNPEFASSSLVWILPSMCC